MVDPVQALVGAGLRFARIGIRRGLCAKGLKGALEANQSVGPEARSGPLDRHI